MRIAMWSGPRNLSTAMMYAFAQRPDFAVWDEPFYAAYLAASGIDHPMRDEVIAAGETDPAGVIARCLGPVPDGKEHFYQKHMTQHMLPEFPLEWLAEVTNVFLIRHPMRVVASYARKRQNPGADDLGFKRQFELFEAVRAMGQDPVVIDSADIRADPEGMLGALLEAVGIPSDEWLPNAGPQIMLQWPAGGIPEDGVWAPHWYGAVQRSTGFAGPEAPLPDLEGAAGELADGAMGYYEALSRSKLTL
ncbi:MAG: sulfotransferase [Alphaproteobacteria bacterium]|nr:sulfotransferase [Alphaproteobacteria bacterium]NNF24223.1 HAD family hydrolase [Paracoccaceae bacterium]